MVRKARKTQLQFGSTAGSQEISEFGSLAAGTPEYSTNPADIQSRSQFLAGWVAAAIGSSPAIEDENALHYLWSYQLQYVLEVGIPEWDANTTYYVGDVVSSGDQYGFIYVSIADSQSNHAVTNTSYWRLQTNQWATTLTSGKTLAAADHGTIIPCNTTGGAFSITLPLGGAPKNFRFTIKDPLGTFQTNALTIVRNGSEKIENVAASFICNQKYGVYTFETDGTDWWIVSQNPQIDPSTKAVTLGSKAITNNQVFIPNNGYITSDTADAADNKTMTVSGGGGGSAWNQNRGAGIVMNGNEVSGAEGEAVYYAGNAAGTFSRHRWVAGGIDVGLITKDGYWDIGPAGAIGSTTFRGARIVGKTDGVDYAAGYVAAPPSEASGTGVATVTAAGGTNIATLTLGVGLWLVSAGSYSDNVATQTGALHRLYIKGVNSATFGKDYAQFIAAPAQAHTYTFPNALVNIATGDADKTIKVNQKAFTAAGNGSAWISAIRIG